MSFHSSIAHFLVLNNIPLFVPPFIDSDTEGHLGCFQVLVIINKIALFTRAGFSVDKNYLTLGVNSKECDCQITW